MQDRIPNLTAETLEGVALWFANMEAAGLSFHPEDNPADVISLMGGRNPIFTDEECDKINDIMGRIYGVTEDPCAVLSEVLDALNNLTARNRHSDGPAVWAQRNPQEARQLEEFAEEYPETFAAISETPSCKAVTQKELIELALNAACLAIQQKLGVTDGGIAGITFCDGGVAHGKFAEAMALYINAERG